MDPMLNEPQPTEPQEAVKEDAWTQLQKKRRPKKKPLRLPAFLTRIGQDVPWYYDIRLWSPLILLLLVLALLPGNQAPAKPEETAPAESAAETLPEAEPAPTEKIRAPKAEALAKLADSVGMGRSDNVKTVIMWVAVNRSEDRANGYGQSLLDEIARPNQWQGYDPEVRYTEETYALAEQVLSTQASGGLRPLDSDMLWLVLNDDGSVTLRNRFTATATQKWHEKTVK